MSRILVIGGGTYQVTLIRRIIENGHEAYCVDRNPSAPGFACATGSKIADVLDTDACLSYAKELGIDAVMTYGATLTLPTVSRIGHTLGLPALPVETADIAGNKFRIKQLLAARGCHVNGDFFAMHSLSDAKAHHFSFPCVIKPSDGSGSKGVSVVQNETGLDAALQYAFAGARFGEIYCESFVKGEEYSVETFVSEEKVYIYGIVKTTFVRHGAHNRDIEYGHRTPSGLDEAAKERIEEEITRAVRALGVTMGSVNFDVILAAHDGLPYIIDCGIRVGQNLIASHLIPLSRGVSVIDNTILQALGKPCDAQPKRNVCVATRLLIGEPGRLAAIKPFDGLIGTNGIADIVVRKHVGDIQNPYRDKSDNLGWVICRGETPDEAEQNAENARRKLADYFIIGSEGEAT